MLSYLDILTKVRTEGVDKETRNGTVRALFAVQFRHDLSEGFPILTTRRIRFDWVIGELLWFIEGSSDDRRLKEISGIPAVRSSIWTANARAPWWRDKAKFDGDLGRLYGVQWRGWQRTDGGTIDQLRVLVDGLRMRPHRRNHVVSAWNVGELDAMALNPCHMLFQCFVGDSRRLSLHMVQRAADLFHGVPFNIASYAALCHMLAQVTGLVADELIITFNDAHIYHAHFEAVAKQLERSPLTLPKLHLNPQRHELEQFELADISLQGYQHYPAISAPFML